MRRTGLARGQGMKLAVSSAPKARKVFVSYPRAGRRALLGIQTAHLPRARWAFWWVIFREQTWVTSVLPQFPCRERRTETHKWLGSVHLHPQTPECTRKMTHVRVNCGETIDSKGVIGAAPILCRQICTEIAGEP